MKKIINAITIFSKRFKANFISPFFTKYSPGKIAMFHIGRSGSTVLGDLLEQNKKCFWCGEIYHKGSILLNKKGVEAGSSEYQAKLWNFYLKQLKKAGSAYYGFEVKFYHLDFLGITIEDYLDRLNEIGITHYIILERKNHLKKIVSSMIARKDGFFHRRVGQDKKFRQVEIDFNKIHIDKTENSLIGFLDNYKNNFVKLRKLLEGKNILELSYEEDISYDPMIAYTKVCDFLNIDKTKAKINFLKTNPYKLSELVVNFSELKDHLINTEYYWMVDE